MNGDFAVWCEACGHDHQAREHSVPCTSCKKPTTAVHGECYACQERTRAHFASAYGLELMAKA